MVIPLQLLTWISKLKLSPIRAFRWDVNCYSTTYDFWFQSLPLNLPREIIFQGVYIYQSHFFKPSMFSNSSIFVTYTVGAVFKSADSIVLKAFFLGLYCSSDSIAQSLGNEFDYYV